MDNQGSHNGVSAGESRLFPAVLLRLAAHTYRISAHFSFPQVNFLIFINVIRILVQKLRSPSVGGNDTSHFK